MPLDHLSWNRSIVSVSIDGHRSLFFQNLLVDLFESGRRTFTTLAASQPQLERLGRNSVAGEGEPIANQESNKSVIPRFSAIGKSVLRAISGTILVSSFWVGGSRCIFIEIPQSRPCPLFPHSFPSPCKWHSRIITLTFSTNQNWFINGII